MAAEKVLLKQVFKYKPSSFLSHFVLKHYGAASSQLHFNRTSVSPLLSSPS
jgi:hypothetical protein